MHQPVAIAEDMTDRALLTGITHESVYTPKINFVRAMLYACLLKHQPKMTYAEAKVLVTRENLATIWRAVVDAYVGNMVVDKSDDDSKPDEDYKPDDVPTQAQG